MEKDEFDALVKTMPHRQVMASLKIYLPRMLSKTLGVTKSNIFLLEENIAAGATGPDIIEESLKYAQEIVDSYYSAEEAAQIKAQMTGVSVATVDESDEDYSDPVTETIIDQTILQGNDPQTSPPPPVIEKKEDLRPPAAGPATAPGLTRDQKISEILKTVKDNGSISIEDLSRYGINVFNDTKTINLADQAILTRDTGNEAHFILLKKKNYETEIAAMVFGAVLISLGINSVIRKR